ncbi:unnamed protein product [Effrenium voratum]|uniref:Uncharacterized protein n=1 Tax=Effrenium voratum TaxID=2562239 RepID=A0AA36MRE8_9DINO|nr:unnamed protein product [Effrenium voratum]
MVMSSSQSLPVTYSPKSPPSNRPERVLGGLLPVSALASCAEPPRSLVSFSLSSALIPAEASSESSPGSLPVSDFLARKLEAMAEELTGTRLAAAESKKAAEERAAALAEELAMERRERHLEKQAWEEERQQMAACLRAALEQLPPLAASCDTVGIDF